MYTKGSPSQATAELKISHWREDGDLCTPSPYSKPIASSPVSRRKRHDNCFDCQHDNTESSRQRADSKDCFETCRVAMASSMTCGDKA